ncbi:DUF7521 family protein [Halovivax cerinus]|uniref:Uncharacterized protein n=1 Tax=Halovivax cerinus TaxID=1487865 RepID=A0ABD5NRB0_9EURY|nr:hypothetical protein [Halovivax cerinus]
MGSTPLSVWGSELPPEWVLGFQQVTQLVSVCVGLVIAYYAYRGYRRNESRPMLFLAAGFVLAFAVPFCVLVVYSIVPGVPVGAAVIASQTSQVLGLLTVLYAIRMPT